LRCRWLPGPAGLPEDAALVLRRPRRQSATLPGQANDAMALLLFMLVLPVFTFLFWRR
jgi:hypothetical protein